MAQKEQNHRLATDSWEEQVLNVIESKKFVTSASVLKDMGFNIQQTSTHDQKRVNDILRNAKWVYKQHKLDSGKRVRGWVNPIYIKKQKGHQELEEVEIEL
jgi:predicted P-loop ATPase